MKIEKGLMLSAAVISTIIASSVAGAADVATNSHDSWVTAKAKIALFADSRVKGTEINVETKNGLVMLRGKVDSDDAKKAAAEIAKSVDGATSVKNELQVVARSQRAMIDEKDEVIALRVQKHLKEIKHAHISVKSNAGVVSLTGEVKDLASSAKASWKAWTVHGVKSVKNDLTIKEKS